MIEMTTNVWKKKTYCADPKYNLNLFDRTRMMNFNGKVFASSFPFTVTVSMIELDINKHLIENIIITFAKPENVQTSKLLYWLGSVQISERTPS